MKSQNEIPNSTLSSSGLSTTSFRQAQYTAIANYLTTNKTKKNFNVYYFLLLIHY